MKLEVDPESLLSAPTNNDSQEKLERDVHGFLVKLGAEKGVVRQYSRQYAHSYTVRLWGARPSLEEKVKAVWKDIPMKKIADLCESTGQETSDNHTSVGDQKDSGDHGQNIAFHEDIVVAIIGTIFKQQPEKPSILQDLSEDNPMVPVVVKQKYISNNDTILLEDETTRVRIIPSEGCTLKINNTVNGVVCALKGKPNVNGRFEVNEVIYATPSKPKPIKCKSEIEMVFVSGLQLGTECSHSVYLDLLFDYLEGLSGSPEEQKCNRKKSQVFFLGNCFAANETKDENDQKNLTSQYEICYKLDQMFDQLSRTMEVFIIPGFNDPTSKMLPQPKLHGALFPKSDRRPTFHSLANPSRLQVALKQKPAKGEINFDSDSVDIIMTSGENVKDAIRNCDIDCPLEMSQKLLEWGHLCPTAPDTLALQPGVPDDVFILKSLPNLFVVGNQDSFGIKKWNDTTIISVPEFSKTFTVALLTDSMNVMPISFHNL